MLRLLWHTQQRVLKLNVFIAPFWKWQNRLLMKVHAKQLTNYLIKEYNNTIHSVTEEKPLKVLFNQDSFRNIANKIGKHQDQMLRFHNATRGHKVFSPGEEIFVKSD